jgi:hypothetical protein
MATASPTPQQQQQLQANNNCTKFSDNYEIKEELGK